MGTSIANAEKIILTLSLNKSNVNDFLRLIKILKFPVSIVNKIEKEETPMELLARFGAESPELPMSEEELMDFINAEIKTLREEKRQELEKQVKQ